MKNLPQQSPRRTVLAVAAIVYLCCIIGAMAPVAYSAAPEPVRIENFVSVFSPDVVHKSASFAQIVEYAKDIGLASIRVGIRWDNAQPLPGVYNWKTFDAKVEIANRAGLKVHGLITRTPFWAESRSPSALKTPRPKDLAAFVAAAVERYNGDGKNDALGSDGKPLLVEAWEINHEQDYKRVWDSANPPADYALVYREAVAAGRAVDPRIPVMTGGLSARATTNYPRQVFANLDPEDLSGFLPVHLYRLPDSPESAVGSRYSKQTFLERIFEFKRDVFDVYAPGTNMRLWVAAIGWPSWPTPPLPTTAYVTDDDQANYLVRTMVLALSTQMVEGLAIACDFVDDSVCSDPPWTHTGVVRSDGTKKPSYFAMKTAIAMLRGADYAGADYLGPHNYALHFQRDDTTVTVLWNASHLGTSTASQVEVAAGDLSALQIFDRDGRRLDPQLKDERVILTLTGSPLYLLRQGIEVVPSPVVAPDRLSGSPGDEITLKVQLLNPFSHSLKGTFPLDLPPGWAAEEVSKPYDLAPLGLAVLDFTVTVPPAAQTGELELTGKMAGEKGISTVTAAWLSLAKTKVVTNFESGLVGWNMTASNAKGSVELSTEATPSGCPAARITMWPDLEASSRIVQITRPVSLPVGGEPKGIGLWVKGDDSGCQINYQVVDRYGERFVVIAAQPIDWTGWKYISAPIEHFASHSGTNANGVIDYPVSFQSVMVSCRASYVPEKVEILIDEIVATYE